MKKLKLISVPAGKLPAGGRKIVGSVKAAAGLGLKAIPCLIFCAWVGGCGGDAVSPPRSPDLDASRGYSGPSYTIQAGVFSSRENARKMTESLRDKGLDTVRLHEEGGLHKVRFGRFPSREAALRKAEELSEKGVIRDFYVVRLEGGGRDLGMSVKNRELRSRLVDTARGYIGTPYKWSGSSPDDGFDCSGLTMAVYEKNGLNLPRTARRQWQVGEPRRREDLLEGDLVFFSIAKGVKTSHVGIYIGDDRFVHAPGEGEEVRIETLSKSYFKRVFIGGRSYLE